MCVCTCESVSLCACVGCLYWCVCRCVGIGVFLLLTSYIFFIVCALAFANEFFFT